MHIAIDEQKLIDKMAWKLMPFLGLLYLVAYIDRQNVSYAKLQMVASLGLSEASYGLGASLFFIGYLLFEVPSNVILHKVGARIWFARIMFSWGLVTLALAYTQNATMFYILRFLLGATEAGFYPGVLYYLTLWFPQKHRSRMIGYFLIGSSIANMIGAPIGGALLDLDGLFGMQGWQLTFIFTGLPAVALAFVVFYCLPASPEQASFLNPEERGWLQRRLAREQKELEQTGESGHANPFKTLLDYRVLLLAFFLIFFPLSSYGLSYWLPTIVKSFGVGNTLNGFINMIPWVLVTLVLWWVPRKPGRTEDPIRNILFPALFGAVCLIGSVYFGNPFVKFAMLCLAAACSFTVLPCFWTLPGRFLTGASAAAGIAAINSIGNLGGFIAQNVVPMIRESTGSTIAPMLFLAACMAFGGLFTLVVMYCIRRHERTLVPLSV
ncbi:MFS transporter [Herbaspirillum rhizosphaerae]|uniref:MFS transporter n=1 Tax=Herbaspirillum rhizosphaerae TaxID=346179 RepID=A0ABW8ZAF7_9BURK